MNRITELAEKYSDSRNRDDDDAPAYAARKTFEAGYLKALKDVELALKARSIEIAKLSDQGRIVENRDSIEMIQAMRGEK